MSGSVRLGVNPILWSNDDLRELGGDIPLERCLAEARAAGYAGIELGHKFPESPDEIVAALEPHRLELIGGWHSTFVLGESLRDELASLERHLARLTGAGASVCIAAECSGSVHGDLQRPLGDRPRLTVDEMGKLARGLDELARCAADRGLLFAYHHHAGTVVETLDEIVALLERTRDYVGLLLDTGHLAVAGEDPVRAARTCAERVVHVHLKDVRADVLERLRRGRRSFLWGVVEGIFTVPGDGGVDFRAALRPLVERGYSGWWVVEAEQDPAKAPPAEYAGRGFAAARALAAELYGSAPESSRGVR